jgi:hypothetical protein
MEEIPVTGLEELECHLQQLVDAPDTPLNAKLFDEVELQLTGKLRLWLIVSVLWEETVGLSQVAEAASSLV